MELIQWIIIIFALFAFSRVIIRFHKRDIARGEFIFWNFVWLAVIIVAFLPNLSLQFANIFGVQRGTDFFSYIGLVILFYLVFRIYVKQEKIERDITKIVRGMSFRKGK